MFVIYINTALLWRVFTIMESAEGVRQLSANLSGKRTGRINVFLWRADTVSLFLLFKRVLIFSDSDILNGMELWK